MADEADEADGEERTEHDIPVIKQFVQDVLDFSSHYGSDSSLSYTAYNIIGKANVYPNYGDFADTFLLRTFGPWWQKSPSFYKSFQLRNQTSFCGQDFIDLKFETPVYPLCVDIYETFNPGAVVRILAFDCERCTWQSLWQGNPNSPWFSTESRVFSPPIKTTSFHTSVIRLEFCHRYLDYYSELDAVLLVGSTKSVFSNAKLRSTYEKRHGLTLDLPKEPVLKNGVVQRKDETVEETKMEQNWFEKLPHEVINLIISFLDLPSLCKAACLNKLFRQHCYDSLLYTELDLQSCWEKISKQTLLGLETRCCNLLKLNLSWCGHYDRISLQSFINFLENCASQLTHLRLANCQFLSNEGLRTVAIVCTNLCELDIRCCRQKWLDQFGFQEISRMINLQRLNLYRTLIDTQSMISIIRNCTKLEHLNLGSCIAINNFDDVVTELAQNCGNIKSLDLWRAKTLTAVGISNLARNCSQLQEIDIGWCTEISTLGGCLIELAQNCCRLKKLFVTAIRTICDADIGALTCCCPHLEQLDILGTREVSSVAVLRALYELKRLQYLDVSFCAQISSEIVENWRLVFPHVSIKKSFQTSSTVTT